MHIEAWKRNEQSDMQILLNIMYEAPCKYRQQNLCIALCNQSVIGYPLLDIKNLAEIGFHQELNLCRINAWMPGRMALHSVPGLDVTGRIVHLIFDCCTYFTP